MCAKGCNGLARVCVCDRHHHRSCPRGDNDEAIICLVSDFHKIGGIFSNTAAGARTIFGLVASCGGHIWCFVQSTHTHTLQKHPVVVVVVGTFRVY